MWAAAFVAVTAGLFWLLSPVFAVLAASTALAYLLDPIADWLERRRLSREAAIGLIYIGGLAAVAVLVLVLVPSFLSQWEEIQGRLDGFEPDLYPRIEPVLVRLGEAVGQDLTLGAENVERMRARVPELIQENLPKLQALISRTGGELLTRGLGLINVVLNLTLLPIFVFYLLRDWDKLTQGLANLVPAPQRPRALRVAGEIDQRLSAFVRGQITVAMAMGGMYSVGLLVAGIDLAIPVGVLSGILAVVPYLGTAVGIVLSLVLALIEFGFDIHLLYVLMVFGAVQFVEGNFLTPRIVGDSVGLHPLVVMIAVIAGGGLLGVWGMLLAIPVTAALSVFGAEWLELYLASGVYRGHEVDGAAPVLPDAPSARPAAPTPSAPTPPAPPPAALDG